MSWPWEWASTTPETASLLTRFMLAGDYVAVALWLVGACLLVPIVLELVFRFALLEFLEQRGQSHHGGRGDVVVALRRHRTSCPCAPPRARHCTHAAVATVLGALLGIVAVRGRRGRGLGLAIIAHGSFVAVQLAVLIRALPTG